jgi:hypothetical protein
VSVIDQLICYFQSRGALSEEQLKALEEQGFLHPDEPGGDDFFDALSRSWEGAPAGTEEDPTEALAARPARRSRGGKSRKGRTLTAPQLCERLAEESPSWDAPLRGLTVLARQLAPCRDWREAVLAIRQVEPPHLAEGLQAGLARRAFTLEKLWQALGMDGYCDLVADRKLHGQAVTAYRSLLAAPDLASIAKHRWILKHEPIAEVFRLCVAKRRVYHACRTVYEDRPQTLAHALDRRRPTLSYWSLILVYNARREEARGVERLPRLARLERGPVRIPREDLAVPAWTHALMLDPEHVTRYLVQCFGPAALGTPDSWWRDHALHCPADWPWFIAG